MKNLIRKQMLEERNKISPSEVRNLSRSIFDRLLASGLLNTAADIMTYLSFKTEVETDAIISYGLENGKSIYVPVCVSETRELVISRVTCFADLQWGFYGIREPKQSSLRLCDSNVLDLIIVPGAAFDPSGNRIGFGAGYYDRFLKRLTPGVKKVALAYSFQVVDNIPSSEYDVPVDYIATEKEIIHCKRSN